MDIPASLRDPLPRNESYPLGRQVLDAALEAAGVERVDVVYFLRAGIDEWRRTASGAVMNCRFRAATRDHRERVEIRIHAVPSEHKHDVAHALLPDHLPRFVAWVRSSETAGNVWRSADHSIAISWDGGALRIAQR